jgi:hypothetical protein
MDTGVDLGVIKKRQQVAWSTGDYAVVGTTLQIVGENLCESSISAQEQACWTSPRAMGTQHSPRLVAGVR